MSEAKKLGPGVKWCAYCHQPIPAEDDKVMYGIGVYTHTYCPAPICRRITMTNPKTDSGQDYAIISSASQKDRKDLERFAEQEARIQKNICPNNCGEMVIDDPHNRHCPKCNFSQFSSKPIPAQQPSTERGKCHYCIQGIPKDKHGLHRNTEDGDQYCIVPDPAPEGKVCIVCKQPHEQLTAVGPKEYRCPNCLFAPKGKTEPEMRLETGMENIARDMREGRFPQRSEPQQVPICAPQTQEATPAPKAVPATQPKTQADQKEYDPIDDLEYVVREYPISQDATRRLEFAIHVLKEMRELSAPKAVEPRPECPTCQKGLIVVVETSPADYQAVEVAVTCEDGTCDYKEFPGIDIENYRKFFSQPVASPKEEK
jgi:hypothetical protein